MFDSLRGLFGQTERIRHFAEIKAIFHSLFYSSCRAPVVVVVVVVIITESDFFAGLKSFCLVSVASILEGSYTVHVFGIKYNQLVYLEVFGRTNRAMFQSHERHTLHHALPGLTSSINSS